MKYTIDQVTAEIVAGLPNVSPEDRNIFRNWAIRGLKQLGPNRNDVKIAQITPNSNGLLKKPDDFTHGIDLSLFNSGDQEIFYNFNHGGSRIHVDRFSIQDENNQDAITGRVDVSEDAYYYLLGNNSSVVAYALIRYFAYPVDSEGLPTFEEEDMEAIIDYCTYRLSRRKGDNRSEIQQNYEIWMASMDRRKAAKKMPDMQSAKGIMQRWLSMLPLGLDSNY